MAHTHHFVESFQPGSVDTIDSGLSLGDDSAITIGDTVTCRIWIVELSLHEQENELSPHKRENELFANLTSLDDKILVIDNTSPAGLEGALVSILLGRRMDSRIMYPRDKHIYFIEISECSRGSLKFNSSNYESFKRTLSVLANKSIKKQLDFLYSDLAVKQLVLWSYWDQGTLSMTDDFNDMEFEDLRWGILVALSCMESSNALQALHDDIKGWMALGDAKRQLKTMERSRARDPNRFCRQLRRKYRYACADSFSVQRFPAFH